MIVVGAGPSGLTAAACLALHGVPLRILDRRPRPSLDSRAVGIHARTLEVFEQLDVVDAFLARGRRAVGLEFHMPAGRRRFDLFGPGVFPSRYPQMLLLEQSVTEELLRDVLESLGHRVEWGMELVALRHDEPGVTLRVRAADGEERVVGARWVIGADGADSTVRHAIGAPFSGSTYEQRYAVADVRVAGRKLDASHLHLSFTRTGFVLLVPLPRAGVFRLATDFPPGFRGAERDPAFADIRAHVQEVFPGGIELHDPAWYSTTRFHSRCAQELRSGPAFLVGDAAHIHSPVGGQGMNTGIQDSHALAWRLAMVAQRRIPAKALDTYEAERLPVARALVHTTDMVFRIVDHPGSLPRWLRVQVLPRALSAAVRVPALRRALARRVAQVGIRYRRGMLVPGGGRPPRGLPGPGERFPYLTFRRGGESLSTPALLDYRRHHLLVLGESARTGGPARAIAGRLGDTVACHPVCMTEEEPGDAWACEPPSRAAVNRTAEGCCLVRPDGYVALTAASLDPDVVGGRVAAYLGGEGWAPT